MFYAEAKNRVNARGWTLRKTDWGDFVAYPKGRSCDDPCAYFTGDLVDAVDTVEAITKGEG